MFAAGNIIRSADRKYEQLGTEAGPLETAKRQIASRDTQTDFEAQSNTENVNTNGHSDLGIDRRTRAMAIDLEVRKCELWRESGWWAGGCTV